jgi:hypothetical protein
VSRSFDDYRRAATILWGDAGTFMLDTFAELNAELFDGQLPPLPMTIAMVPYGACVGATAPKANHGDTPQIVLPPEIFNGSARLDGGAAYVRDVITHEMVHARLMLDGRDPKHNGEPWCREITRLSPVVLRREIRAAPVKARRIDGRVVKAPRDGYLPRAVLARWPHSLRPADWEPGPVIPVPTY